MRSDYTSLFPDDRDKGETVLKQAQNVMLRIFKIFDHICEKHSLNYWMCSGTLLGAVRHQGFIPWDDDLDISMPREDYEQFLKIASMELPEDIYLQTRDTDKFYDYLPLPCKLRDTKSLIISEGTKNKKYHQGIFIDIFPTDKFHSNKSILKQEKRYKKIFYWLCKGLNCELDKNSFKKRAIAVCKPLFISLTKNYLEKAEILIKENKTLDSEYLIGAGFDTPWIRYFTYEEIFPLKEYCFEGYFFKGPNNANAYLTQMYGKDYMTPPPPEKRVQTHGVILKPILSSPSHYK
ncbi:MAG: LicD family protein [Tannerellaceae bacterium]|nr:LicD family protein [Tannerellaceae bacterium]